MTGLPYEVGCPAFTHELRQFQWPSHRMFKPDVGEKYNRMTHPSEFLGIYTIAMQAAGAREDKVLANYFSLALKPNVMSWLMHFPVDFISSWSDLCHKFVGAFTGGHQANARQVICMSSHRRMARTCTSTSKGSAVCSTTSPMFTPPP